MSSFVPVVDFDIHLRNRLYATLSDKILILEISLVNWDELLLTVIDSVGL